MAQIAGISTEKNKKGIVTKITIDLKKHPNAKKPLAEMGFIELDPFEEMVKNGHYTPIDKARTELLNYVKSLWK